MVIAVASTVFVNNFFRRSQRNRNRDLKISARVILVCITTVIAIVLFIQTGIVKMNVMGWSKLTTLRI